MDGADIRIECLGLALEYSVRPFDTSKVIEQAERFYNFVVNDKRNVLSLEKSPKETTAIALDPKRGAKPKKGK